MNMRKYASYKQAAKRIIRLNQDPMKKQAFLGGLFGRRRKEYDDYGLPFDFAGGEGNIVDLGDEGRYISLGDGVMIQLPDNIGDDDYEEVGPKFKKESAAKRIVRMTKRAEGPTLYDRLAVGAENFFGGIDRGIKGTGRAVKHFFFPPVDSQAAQVGPGGKPLNVEPSSAAWNHPYTYGQVYIRNKDGKIEPQAVPLSWLHRAPEFYRLSAESKESGPGWENRPYISPINPLSIDESVGGPNLQEIVDTRDKLNREAAPFIKRQKELGVYDAKPSGYSPVWNRKPRRIK